MGTIKFSQVYGRSLLGDKVELTEGDPVAASTGEDIEEVIEGGKDDNSPALWLLGIVVSLVLVRLLWEVAGGEK